MIRLGACLGALGYPWGSSKDPNGDRIPRCAHHSSRPLRAPFCSPCHQGGRAGSPPPLLWTQLPVALRLLSVRQGWHLQKVTAEMEAVHSQHCPLSVCTSGVALSRAGSDAHGPAGTASGPEHAESCRAGSCRLAASPLAPKLGYLCPWAQVAAPQLLRELLSCPLCCTLLLLVLGGHPSMSPSSVGPCR